MGKSQMDAAVKSKEESVPKKNLRSAKGHWGHLGEPSSWTWAGRKFHIRREEGKERSKSGFAILLPWKDSFSESRSCLSRKSPAPAGSFFTALWKCLAVLSFSTHSPETAVLLYLCTREQSSSRLWVLHSWTLWSLLPSGGAYVVPGRAHHPGMLLPT